MRVETRPMTIMHLVKRGRHSPDLCGKQPDSQLSSALGQPWGGKEATNDIPANQRRTGTWDRESSLSTQRIYTKSSSSQARGTRNEDTREEKGFGPLCLEGRF